MKQFLHRWWNDTGVKWLVLLFGPIVATIWTTFWSIQDGRFNGWPIVIVAATIFCHMLFSWVFRNNP